MDLKRIVVKSAAFSLALLFVFVSALGLTCFNGNAAVTETTTGGSVKKSGESYDYNCSVGLRFNAGSSFSSVGIELNTAGTGGKVIVASLYSWQGDMNKTVDKGSIASVTLTNWKKSDVLSITAANAGLSAFDAGEYYYELFFAEGSGFKINWYSPCKDNVCAYANRYTKKGAPYFVINHNGDANSFLKQISPGSPYSVAAPEEQSLSEDSAIVKMGVDSTLWNAVDGLGRTLPSYSEVGNKRDKVVGIFYWTWHLNSASGKPANVNSILSEYPEAVNDYNHSVWKKYEGNAFWWNEPLFGYYTELDDYVLRKHAELLADAGIDFVLFDCTNGTLTFDEAFFNLLKVWDQARKDGVNTPKIGFMLPFGDEDNTKTSLKNLFYKLYRPGLYQDLWFYWEGKPMIMAISKMLDESDEEERDIKNFFTFRKGEPSYWLEDSTDAEWGWLHVYPQAKYYNSDGTVEQMTVGIAQNANYETRKLSAMNSGKNMGRGFSMQEDFSYSYDYRGEKIICSSKMENAHYYGINFQEQWDFALETDPEIVFVTGWNEWLVGRYDMWGDVENAFPDQCNDPNSRDIEPSKGELKDYYYYQLVANVRKYKGMTYPETKLAKTIDITKGTEQWNEGVTVYNHYTNNTYERDNNGFKGTHYNNPGIRNDFMTLKASYDDANLYFYAETVNDITPSSDADWMRLILDTGAATADSKDWEEFEFIVGREQGTDSTLALERSTGGWNWEKVCDVKYTVSGRVMQVEIPREALGIAGTDFKIGFKWADANLSDGDIMTLYTDGDSAPLGRFTFVLTNTETEPVVEPPVDHPSSGCGGGCGNILGGAFVPLCIAVFAVCGAALSKKSGSKGE